MTAKAVVMPSSAAVDGVCPDSSTPVCVSSTSVPPSRWVVGPQNYESSSSIERSTFWQCESSLGCSIGSAS